MMIRSRTRVVLVRDHPIMSRMGDPVIKRAFELGVMVRAHGDRRAGESPQAPYEAGSDLWKAWMAGALGPMGRLAI